MRLELFQNFIAVVEYGTITAAAREMRIAQPALSAQLRTLEEDLGVLLLKRNTRNVELTEAGRVFYARGKDICRIESDLRLELKDQSLGMRGALRIGIAESIPSLFTDRLLSVANQKVTSIRFSIYSGGSADICSMVKEGVVDIGIACIRDPLPHGLQAVLSVPERLSIVGSVNQRKLHSITDLCGISLGLARRAEEVFRQACAEEGFVPNIRCVSDTYHCLQFLAEQGRITAILYHSKLDELPASVYHSSLLELEKFTFQRTFLTRKNTKLSSDCEVFLDCARHLYS